MENKEKDYTEKDLEIINRAVEDDDDDVDDSFKQKKTTGNSKTPVLDSFSKDLTKMAEDGKLDIIVGRVKEIERVSQILSRRKKNNPILIGSPGCVNGETLITIRKTSDDEGHEIINI